MKKKLMGEHWDTTKFPKLYQLSRRVEKVAALLEIRRQRGWQPTTELVAELNDVAIQLKVLDIQTLQEAKKT